jgi:hypothetical protein
MGTGKRSALDVLTLFVMLNVERFNALPRVARVTILVLVFLEVATLLRAGLGMSYSKRGR